MSIVNCRRGTDAASETGSGEFESQIAALKEMGFPTEGVRPNPVCVRGGEVNVQY